LYNVTISIDSVFNGTADLNTSTTVWAYSLNGLPDGIHNISINITDTHNSRLQLSRILTVDTTAPSVVFTNFSSSNVNKSVAIVGNLVVLNFTASELLNTSSSYVVIANSVRPIVNVSGTNYTANYTLATGDIEGLISYSFILYDMIGNNFSQTNQSTVLFDNKPTGSLTSLTAGTTTYLNPNIVNYTIYGLANDTYGVLNITVSLNNTLRGIAIGNYNSSTTVWNYTIVGTINPGQYNITVNITDTVGNIKQLNATIVLDNVAPAFSIVIPTASIYSATAGSMLTLNFTPTDNSGNMSACWYTLTGPVNATSVSINSCTSGVLSSTQLYLSNGTYNITLYANDIFGNNVSTNVLFNVSDTVAPAITINSPTATTYNAGSVDINVTTDENATCNWLSSTTAGQTYTYAELAGTFINSATLHTTTISASAGDSYTIYVSCIDMSNNNATIQSVTFSTAPASSSSPSSSDGGSSGGGGAAPDPSQSVSFDLLPAGSQVIGISSTSIPVSEIFLTTIAASTNVKFVVTAVSSPSNKYTEKVYKYIQVDHAAVGDGIIDSAKIKFKIDKSWLTSNNKDKEDMVLFRYTNKWVALTTTITNEDTSYVYYLADSPGLSLFAISTKAVNSTVNTTTVANNTAAITNNTKITANNTSGNRTGNSTSAGSGSKDLTWPIIILAIIVVVVALLLFAKKQRKKNTAPPVA
jgi:PGF-pre-PGF domain-containing protein